MYSLFINFDICVKSYKLKSTRNLHITWAIFFLFFIRNSEINP